MHRLLSDERGSLLPWAVLSLILLMGMLAVLLDGGRYFLLKNRLLNVAHMAAGYGAEMSDLLPEEELLASIRLIVRSELGEDDGFLSLARRDYSLSLIEGSHSSTDFSVTIKGELTPFLLSTLGIKAGFQVSVNSVRRSEPIPSHIGMVLDHAATNPDIRATAEYFLSKLTAINSAEEIRLALIPNATNLINVAPHKEWVMPGHWPAAVPPNVPGRAMWSGALEDQRWCVHPRPGGVRKTSNPPAMQPFEIAMEITVETAADGTDEYAVTTTDECPAVSITPLKADQTAARQAVQNLNDSGDFYPGRGLVWGLRTLSPKWKGVWRGEARIPNPEKQIIFMMVSAAPTNNADDQADFAAACNEAVSSGIMIYAAGPQSAVDELATSCDMEKFRYLGTDYVQASLRLLASLREIH